MPNAPYFDEAALKRAALVELMQQQPDAASSAQGEPTNTRMAPWAQGALVGGNAFDLGTTLHALSRPGTREGNPVLGQHSGRIAAIKGGSTLLQLLVLRKLGQTHPRVANALGVGLGGAMGAVGARNLTVPK